MLIIGGATIGAGAAPLHEARDGRLVVLDFTGPLRRTSPLTPTVFRRQTRSGWVQAVLEHVLSPETVVGEINRVLREDGLAYAETPTMQQVHEEPYDYTRFTESGHRWLFRRFELIDSRAVHGPFTVLLH